MIEVQNLTKIYNQGSRDAFKAVNSVSFSIEKGEIVSLIGESGSGKTTIGKMMLKLSPPTSGGISFAGKSIGGIRRAGDIKEYYRKVQGVFQDPFSTFNPIFKADRIFSIIRREFYPEISESDWHMQVLESLRSVGLNPADVLDKYSYQLSGGQLQRLLIARALLLKVDFLVADEIISMLDASTRIDVLNLLGDLKSRGLSVLFVTHDLSLGYYISDKVVILYKGVMVESGETKKVFANPVHPYTKRLLTAVPRLDMKWADMPDLSGNEPDFELFDPDIHSGSPSNREIEDDHFVAVP